MDRKNLFGILFITTLQIVLGKRVDILALNSNCAKPGLQCRDCNTLQFCSTKLQPLLTVKCSDQNPETPYCDSVSNLCTATEPEVCNVGNSSFSCPGVGTYPDPIDCHKYYICDEHKLANEFNCVGDEIYEQGTQSCRLGAPCYSYAPTGLCFGKTNQFVSYAGDRNLYIFCSFGIPPVVLQCPNKYDVLVEKTQRCNFQCTKSGFFPYAKDSKKFYACLQNGIDFIQSLLECMSGTEFVVTGDGNGVCTIKTTTTSTTTEITTTAIINEDITNPITIETQESTEETTNSENVQEVDEPNNNQSETEEPQAQDPVVDESETEEPQDPVADESETEEPEPQDPVADESETEEPEAQDPVVNESETEEPQDPVTEKNEEPEVITTIAEIQEEVTNETVIDTEAIGEESNPNQDSEIETPESKDETDVPATETEDVA